MIARISGTVVSKRDNHLIVDLGGMALRVHVPPDTARAARDKTTLWTYLAVRENALDLYGFTANDDADFFELLLSVSGIGPKGALGILSLAPASALKPAIARGDAGYLQRVYGVSKKTAEKLALELKNKVGPSAGGGVSSSVEGDVVDAIIALGYSAAEARAAVRDIPPSVENVELRIKEALKRLG